MVGKQGFKLRPPAEPEKPDKPALKCSMYSDKAEATFTLDSIASCSRSYADAPVMINRTGIEGVYRLELIAYSG